MPTISEPRWPALAERAARFDRLLTEGAIGEATYLRSLFIDGWLPDEARTRLKLLKMSQQWRK